MPVLCHGPNQAIHTVLIYTLYSRSMRILFAITAVVLWSFTLTWGQTVNLDAELIRAAEAGNVERVQTLLGQGAKVNARDTQGRSALLAATRTNHIEVARVLIQNGADVNLQDNIQDSAHLYAGAAGHVEILKLTLEAGADFKVPNRFGGNALIPACERGHVEVVKLMLTTKINLDHVNRLGWTCLLEAIILSNGGPKHQEIVRLLVKAGANVNLADGSGVTPLQHARQKGFKEIVAILEETGGK